VSTLPLVELGIVLLLVGLGSLRAAVVVAKR
jgi:hypothetical protein